MVKSKTIKLKNARLVFPNEITRVRPHDLISLSIDKKDILTKREATKLIDVADEIKGNLFGSKFDILAKRKGRHIKFIPI